MPKPHELARAMSFRDDYKVGGNQGDQVKQIGNAVPAGLCLDSGAVVELCGGLRCGRLDVVV
jgi:hypothetical protein